MYTNKYTLRQLLEYALRVPEVGAVNFNYLYIILKAVLQHQGLEHIKPNFWMDTPVVTESKSEESVLPEDDSKESAIKKQTDDSKESTIEIERDDTKESVIKIQRHDEAETEAKPVEQKDESTQLEIETKSQGVSTQEDETQKWEKLQFSKRMAAVEEEIGEIHILISQIVDKISNVEGVIGLHERRLMAQINELRVRELDKQIIEDAVKANLNSISKDTALIQEEIKILGEKLSRTSDDLILLNVKNTITGEKFKPLDEAIEDIANRITILKEFEESLKGRIEELEVHVYRTDVEIDTGAPADEVTPLFLHVSTEEFYFKEEHEKAKAVEIEIMHIDREVGKTSEESDSEESEEWEEEVYEAKRSELKIDDDFVEDYLGDLRDEIKTALTGQSGLTTDLLDKHSQQLKGQVIVYVKKQIQSILSDMQQIDSDFRVIKKKIDHIEKQIWTVSENIASQDATFMKKSDELKALKKMAENHQVSLVHVMQQLDRKAECYIVNEKINRHELAAIEHRVQQLCSLTSNEILTMENKLKEALQKLNVELDKKLYTEEYDVRLEPFINKLERIERKLKEFSDENSSNICDKMRPVEIKPYAFKRNGTRFLRGGKRLGSYASTSWNPIPILSHDEKVPAETEKQVKNILENSSIRNTKRYVQGEYTKQKV